MMKNVIALCVCAGLASAASASIFTTSANGPSLDRDGNIGLALGSVVDTGNGVFNTAGGALLNQASAHEIGTSGPMVNVLERPNTVTSSVTTVDDLRTVTMTWRSAPGTAMIQPGDALGGLAITDLSFEVGTANFSGGGIFDPDFIAFDHDVNPADPTTFLGAFTLVDANGATIFDGSFFVDFDAVTSEVGGRTFIAAGGADLSGFNIGGGTATFSYFVIPTPASAALFGLGGLAALRRRR
ncbi:MAG: hypothetical protein EA378_01490 [Phycisphaerales bacterium]|nr:MAG: hypothetical protein EA378_01490 [Phycisphaerales bacterium]